MYNNIDPRLEELVLRGKMDLQTAIKLSNPVGNQNDIRDEVEPKKSSVKKAVELKSDSIKASFVEGLEGYPYLSHQVLNKKMTLGEAMEVKSSEERLRKASVKITAKKSKLLNQKNISSNVGVISSSNGLLIYNICKSKIR